MNSDFIRRLLAVGAIPSIGESDPMVALTLEGSPRDGFVLSTGMGLNGTLPIPAPPEMSDGDREELFGNMKSTVTALRRALRKERLRKKFEDEAQSLKNLLDYLEELDFADFLDDEELSSKLLGFVDRLTRKVRRSRIAHADRPTAQIETLRQVATQIKQYEDSRRTAESVFVVPLSGRLEDVKHLKARLTEAVTEIVREAQGELAEDYGYSRERRQGMEVLVRESSNGEAHVVPLAGEQPEVPEFMRTILEELDAVAKARGFDIKIDLGQRRNDDSNSTMGDRQHQHTGNGAEN